MLIPSQVGAVYGADTLLELKDVMYGNLQEAIEKGINDDEYWTLVFNKDEKKFDFIEFGGVIKTIVSDYIKENIESIINEVVNETLGEKLEKIIEEKIKNILKNKIKSLIREVVVEGLQGLS